MKEVCRAVESKKEDESSRAQRCSAYEFPPSCCRYPNLTLNAQSLRVFRQARDVDVRQQTRDDTCESPTR